MALHHAQTVLGEKKLHFASVTPGGWLQPPWGTAYVASQQHSDPRTTQPHSPWPRGNSSHRSVIFNMQKRVIMVIMGYDCRELFEELKILTLSSQYIFSLLLFVVNNRDYCVSNSVYHNINTRQKKWFTLASGISGHVSEGSLLFRHQNF